MSTSTRLIFRKCQLLVFCFVVFSCALDAFEPELTDEEGLDRFFSSQEERFSHNPFAFTSAINPSPVLDGFQAPAGLNDKQILANTDPTVHQPLPDQFKYHRPAGQNTASTSLAQAPLQNHEIAEPHPSSLVEPLDPYYTSTHGQAIDMNAYDYLGSPFVRTNYKVMFDPIQEFLRAFRPERRLNDQMPHDQGSLPTNPSLGKLESHDFTGLNTAGRSAALVHPQFAQLAHDPQKRNGREACELGQSLLRLPAQQLPSHDAEVTSEPDKGSKNSWKRKQPEFESIWELDPGPAQNSNGVGQGSESFLRSGNTESEFQDQGGETRAINSKKYPTFEDLFRYNRHRSPALMRSEDSLLTTSHKKGKQDIQHDFVEHHPVDRTAESSNRSDWPGIKFDNEIFFNENATEEAKKILEKIYFLFPDAEKDGTIVIRESEIPTLGKRRKTKKIDSKSAQTLSMTDSCERKRLLVSQLNYLSIHEHVWFEYWKNTSGIDVEKQLNSIRLPCIRKLAPTYLFYVEMISKIIPPSEDHEKLDYKTTLQLALNDYLELSSNLYNDEIRDDDPIKNKTSKIEDHIHHRALLGMFHSLAIFLYHWMETSRNSLSVLYPLNHKGRPPNWLKWLLHSIFACSIENLTLRILKHKE